MKVKYSPKRKKVKNKNICRNRSINLGGPANHKFTSKRTIKNAEGVEHTDIICSWCGKVQDEANDPR